MPFFSSLSFVTFSVPIFEALKVLKLKVWTMQWYTNYIFRKWKMCATVLDEQETLPDRCFCCVVLWQAVNCKGQHSISYTLSRNQTVVVEYSHDKDTDMFQVLFCKNKKHPEISPPLFSVCLLTGSWQIFFSNFNMSDLHQS